MFGGKLLYYYEYDQSFGVFKSEPTRQGYSPYGRPVRESLLGEELKVLCLWALPPDIGQVETVLLQAVEPTLNLEGEAVLSHVE